MRHPQRSEKKNSYGRKEWMIYQSFFMHLQIGNNVDDQWVYFTTIKMMWRSDYMSNITRYRQTVFLPYWFRGAGKDHCKWVFVTLGINACFLEIINGVLRQVHTVLYTLLPVGIGVTVDGFPHNQRSMAIAWPRDSLIMSGNVINGYWNTIYVLFLRQNDTTRHRWTNYFVTRNTDWVDTLCESKWLRFVNKRQDHTTQCSISVQIEFLSIDAVGLQTLLNFINIIYSPTYCGTNISKYYWISFAINGYFFIRSS